MNGLTVNEPLISVIVPVYNAEKYLSECIESVISQSYANYELLLIDDGSTDSSSYICENFASTNTKIKVIHKENGGVSSARNMGLECCTGKYLMFLDADDSLTKNCLEILIKGIKLHNADIAAGMAVSDKYEWAENFELWKGKKGVEESLRDNPYSYAAWGKLYRTSFIENTRFRTKYKINEDSFFVFELLCKQPTLVALRDKVYNYRSNPESASKAKFSDKFFDILLVSEHKYRIIKELYPELIGVAENMKLKAQLNMLRILVSRTDGEFTAKEKELEQSIKKNNCFYISGTVDDDRWNFIVKNNLIWLYKCWIRVKRKQ